MKLRYRGNFYDDSHCQTPKTYEAEITAKFRGQTYQLRCPLEQTGSQLSVNLKYRGIPYTLKQAPAPELPTPSKNNSINPAFG
ncbi:MAG: DUF4278 domain-containing protein [Coleofasciculus sp. S288]|nr:DUF4278 domain-containing protein [Coleofasciculus sp. S288]